MTEIVRVGQAQIDELSLTNHTHTEKFNSDFLSQYVDEISIFESIFSPTVTCEFTLQDGSSFKEKTNLSGNEDFKIVFKALGNKKTTTYNLKVYKVSGEAISPTLRAKVYTVKTVSNEQLINHNIFINRSYKASVPKIIETIIRSNLVSTKAFEFESTKDVITVIIPPLSPFKAIDFLKKRAVSENNISSSFVFFETQTGFKFKTIEQLAKDYKKNSQIQEYSQREDLSHNIKGSDAIVTDNVSKWMFSDYSVANDFDLLHLLLGGGFQTTINQYDITRKKLQTQLYTFNPDQFSFLNNTTNHFVTQKIRDDFFIQNYPGNLILPYMSYKDSNEKRDNFILDTVGPRTCFANLFTQKKIYITVPGNNELKAGDLINLKVPRYDEEGSENTVVSGTYMITSIRHILQNGLEIKYDCVLELMRGERGTFKEI